MATPAPHLPIATLVAVGALVAWRFYGRTRRLLQRQLFHPRRSRFNVIFFPILAAVLLWMSYRQPLSVAAELGGFLLGVGLAVYGLRLTKFEETAEGLYYTPNAHIGIALSVLLAGRLAYRFYQVYGAEAAAAHPPQDFTRSPLTLLIFGTLAGYYAWYAWGLIRRHRSISTPAPATSAPQ
ncbi:MAG TPA: hypothetical protein VH814_06280 [Steroidobacteraceae bacterium]|jgi:hypothetical protein